MEHLYWMLIIVLAYLAPALIAHRRRHQNATAIAVLDIAFGWTGIAWAIALIWSLTNNNVRRRRRQP